jgi:hypothetical protein
MTRAPLRYRTLLALAVLVSLWILGVLAPLPAEAARPRPAYICTDANGKVVPGATPDTPGVTCTEPVVEGPIEIGCQQCIASCRAESGGALTSGMCAQACPLCSGQP